MREWVSGPPVNKLVQVEHSYKLKTYDTKIPYIRRDITHCLNTNSCPSLVLALDSGGIITQSRFITQGQTWIITTNVFALEFWEKPSSMPYYSQVPWWRVFPKTGKETATFLLPSPFWIILEVIGIAIRQCKYINRKHKDKKGRNKTVCTCRCVFCKRPKEFTKKLVQHTNVLAKVFGHRVNLKILGFISISWMWNKKCFSLPRPPNFSLLLSCYTRFLS
jgi:hypothetical protein